VKELFFINEQQAVDFLESCGILIVMESNILLPKDASFPEDVHDAIDYLLDNHDYTIKYI